MPMMPAFVSASFTSSSLNGLMIASIFFMAPQRARTVAGAPTLAADAASPPLAAAPNAPDV